MKICYGIQCCGVALVFMLTACAGQPMHDAKIDRLTPEALAQLSPPTRPTLSLQEIVEFSQQAVSADDIIAKIKASNSQYDLTASQIVDLSQQGVDAKVLDFIQVEREKVRLNHISDEISKREKANQEVQTKLKQAAERHQRDWFYNPFYPPFYGDGFSPFWHHPLYWGYPLHRRHR